MNTPFAGIELLGGSVKVIEKAESDVNPYSNDCLSYTKSSIFVDGLF